MAITAQGLRGYRGVVTAVKLLRGSFQKSKRDSINQWVMVLPGRDRRCTTARNPGRIIISNEINEIHRNTLDFRSRARGWRWGRGRVPSQDFVFELELSGSGRPATLSLSQLFPHSPTFNEKEDFSKFHWPKKKNKKRKKKRRIPFPLIRKHDYTFD